MFFHDAGFYKIAGIDDDLVFMENTRTGFSSYLSSLEKTKKDGKKIAAIVMNANPFTRGHEYLIERAAAENDVVHLFIVSEDRSLIPFSVRKQLVLEGSARFSNIIYHDTGSYMISNATFPSYFQKDSVSAIIGHAKLDLFIFCEIAKRLGITARYVGAEKRVSSPGFTTRSCTGNFRKTGSPVSKYRGLPATDARSALPMCVFRSSRMILTACLHWFRNAPTVISPVRKQNLSLKP